MGFANMIQLGKIFYLDGGVGHGEEIYHGWHGLSQIILGLTTDGTDCHR
jgi:hypothetical protein